MNPAPGEISLAAAEAAAFRVCSLMCAGTNQTSGRLLSCVMRKLFQWHVLDNSAWVDPVDPKHMRTPANNLCTIKKCYKFKHDHKNGSQIFIVEINNLGLRV